MDIFSRAAQALRQVLNGKADDLAKKTDLLGGNVKSLGQTL
jgi:hypothetical protein